METRVAVLAVIVQEGSSVQALNELRRDGLAALSDRVLSDYRRKAKKTQEVKEEAA